MPRATVWPVHPEGSGADPIPAAEAALDRICVPGPLGIAVSGGSDSTALLLIAADWAKGRPLHAVTVDHGLRPESGAEAAGVGRLAARIGIPHTVLHWLDASPGGNLQARAREARHRLIGTWARDLGLSSVLLGHTLDDQAETVVLRMLRGSGLDGLAGMSERSRISGTLWLRPFLGLSREALRTELRRRGVGWSEDPSNMDPRFDRVRARQALQGLGALGLTAERLAETATRLAADRAVIGELVDMLAGKARRFGAFGEAWLRTDILVGAPEPIRMRLMAETLRVIGGAAYPTRWDALHALCTKALTPGFGGATLCGCQIAPADDGLLIHRELAAQEGPVTAKPGTLWDNRWQLQGTVPDGCEVRRLGSEGTRILRTAGVSAAPPAAILRTLPALWRGQDLLSVPSVDYATDGVLIGFRDCALCDIRGCDSVDSNARA
ncbi:MAG: tRNA lysidine(34) synthetase TilS [Pseudomonadota bacterium]